MRQINLMLVFAQNLPEALLEWVLAIFVSLLNRIKWASVVHGASEYFTVVEIIRLQMIFIPSTLLILGLKWLSHFRWCSLLYISQLQILVVGALIFGKKIDIGIAVLFLFEIIEVDVDRLIHFRFDQITCRFSLCRQHIFSFLELQGHFCVDFGHRLELVFFFVIGLVCFLIHAGVWEVGWHSGPQLPILQFLLLAIFLILAQCWSVCRSNLSTGVGCEVLLLIWTVIFWAGLIFLRVGSVDHHLLLSVFLNQHFILLVDEALEFTLLQIANQNLSLLRLVHLTELPQLILLEDSEGAEVWGPLSSQIFHLFIELRLRCNICIINSSIHISLAALPNGYKSTHACAHAGARATDGDATCSRFVLVVATTISWAFVKNIGQRCTKAASSTS